MNKRGTISVAWLAVFWTGACGAPDDVAPAPAAQGALSDPSLHGFLIVSEKDPTLAVTFAGSTASGAVINLSRNCTWDNPTCTWSYWNGALVTDADNTLGIKTSSSPVDLELLALGSGCHSAIGQPRSCRWIYQNGRLVSEANPGLALGVSGGLGAGVVLVASAACATSGSSSCRWVIQRAMLTTMGAGPNAMSAWEGAIEGSTIRLWDRCTRTDPLCTWTFRQGMIWSDAAPTLALVPSGGAHQGAWLRIHPDCSTANPDCRWTLRNGLLISDTTSYVAFSSGGPVNGSQIKLTQDCTDTNLKTRDQNCDFVINTAGEQCGHVGQAACAGSVCLEGTPMRSMCRPVETRTIVCSPPVVSSVGSTIWLGISNTGDWSFRSHAHDSGLFGMNYTLGLTFNTLTSSGQRLGYAHGGVVHGTLDAGSRDSDFSTQGNDSRLVDDWDAFSASGGQCNIHTSTNPWLVAEDALTGLSIAAVGTASVLLIGKLNKPGCHWESPDSNTVEWVCPM